MDTSVLESRVQAILTDVRENGDSALRRYTRQFDNVWLEDIRATETELAGAADKVSAPLKSAIAQAGRNIEMFHRAQLEAPRVIETMPGVRCWRKAVAIERVGLYIPGGTAPLFSTILMLAIPARLAGCREIVLCTPPGADGEIHPAVLYAAAVSGITRVYKVGGVQAIAAMAYGTATIPRVDKIFGPGNQYVTCAKQLVAKSGVAIDMPAGPSEVAVLADDTAVPAFVAADLLSQAEHGADSQVLLVTTSPALLSRTLEEIDRQLASLPRAEIARQALSKSRALLVRTLPEAIGVVNRYAPEHLILSVADDEAVAGEVIHAGSVFLGNYSPESVGDYASGTNHTLPTNGYARAYSGVSVDSFVRKITFQKLSPAGLAGIASIVEEMAEAEGLAAHKNAVTLRKNNLNA
jgi:histidinol dehydrogenase